METDHIMDWLTIHVSDMVHTRGESLQDRLRNV